MEQNAGPEVAERSRCGEERGVKDEKTGIEGSKETTATPMGAKRVVTGAST